MAPRDYELDTPVPFKKHDIISMVPVYKVVTDVLLKLLGLT